VKAANYVLKAGGSDYEGSWHVEGIYLSLIISRPFPPTPIHITFIEFVQLMFLFLCYLICMGSLKRARYVT
jgi:hypothetical protein